MHVVAIQDVCLLVLFAGILCDGIKKLVAVIGVVACLWVFVSLWFVSVRSWCLLCI